MGKRMIVGITGASGTIYAVRLLQVLREHGVQTHAVISSSAQTTRAYETTLTRHDFENLADVVYQPTDFAAAISSGSFVTEGMIIAPCSMRTLAEISTGVGTSLVSRAADVTLKERRRLVLLARETPLSLVHLRNMTAVTEAGGIIFPPVPAFYTNPTSPEEIVDQTVGRVLDLFNIHIDTFPRWRPDGQHSPGQPATAAGAADPQPPGPAERA